MFTLTTKSRYAVRALYHLVNCEEGNRVTVKSIAEKEGLSRKYLEAIFQALRKNGIVKGCRGPVGGYLLANPPAQITLLDIINAIEGPVSPVVCLVSGESCKRETPCRAQPLWKGLQQEVEQYLKSVRIVDMLEEGQPECALEYGHRNKEEGNEQNLS